MKLDFRLIILFFVAINISFACKQINPTDPMYSISFNPNGGNGEMIELMAEKGSSIQLTKNTFTRAGYSFSGWSTTQNGTIEYNDQADYKMGKSDVTLYAQWTAIQTFTVTYSAGTDVINVPSPTSHQIGTNAKLSTAESMTWTNHYFVGWSIIENGDTPVTSITNIQENITVYAIWSILPSYTITYVGGVDAVNVPNPSTHFQGSTAILSDPGSMERVHYSFVGWSLVEGSTTPINSIDNIQEDLNVYAIWSALPTYSITYIGGSHAENVPSPSFHIQGTNAILSDAGAMKRTNYSFSGWSLTNGGTTAVTSIGNIQSSKIVYAIWTILPKYKVTYIGGNGANHVPSSANYYKGTNITLNTAHSMKKIHYTFMGWSLTEGGSTAVTSINNIQNDTFLYAIWEEDPKYPVILSAGDGIGSQVFSGEYYVDDIISAPENTGFSKKGYNFDGWKSGYYTKDPGENVTIVDGGIILTAQWTKGKRLIETCPQTG